jgi:hypothetical protein
VDSSAPTTASAPYDDDKLFSTVGGGYELVGNPARVYGSGGQPVNPPTPAGGASPGLMIIMEDVVP